MVVGGRHAPAALPPGKKQGSWVSPRAGLDESEKSRQHSDSIPGPPSPWRVAIWTDVSRSIFCKTVNYDCTYYEITYLFLKYNKCRP